MSKTHGRYIDPLVDMAFKRIFGSGGDRQLLIHFLNQVFGGRKVITDLVYNENEHPGETEIQGGATFDLLCTGEQGEHFLIEVQRTRQKYFKERTLFYASKLVCEQVPYGDRKEWNYELKEIYIIALLDDFRVSDADDKECLHDICLCNRGTREIFYDKLGFTYIQLLNFVKTQEELETEFDWWLYLLKHLHQMNRIPVVLRHSVFERLFHIAEYSKLTKEEKMMYDASLKARWDNKNVMDYAIEQAEAKGEYKKAVETARKMKSKGFSSKAISELTDLTIEEIERL